MALPGDLAAVEPFSGLDDELEYALSQLSERELDELCTEAPDFAPQLQPVTPAPRAATTLRNNCSPTSDVGLPSGSGYTYRFAPRKERR